MALTNFSLPFGPLTTPVHHWGATVSPLHQLASNTNNLLYTSADLQRHDDGSAPTEENDREYYKNYPYAPPQAHQQQQQQQQQPQQQQQYNPYSNNGRRKSGNTYLPPIPPPGVRNSQFNQQTRQQTSQQQQQQQFSHFNSQQQQQQQQPQQQQIKNTNIAYKQQTSSAASTRTYGEGSYNRFPAAPSPTASAPAAIQPNKQFGFNAYSQTKTLSSSLSSTASLSSSSSFNTQQQQQQQQQKTSKQATKTSQIYDSSNIETPATSYGAAVSDSNVGINGGPNDIENTGNDAGNSNDADGASENGAYPHRPPGFTRVQAGQGSRTQVHAVLDYDIEEGEEDYYDENDHGEEVRDGQKKSSMPTVTPIQGPIYLKNGTVPVVPLLSYPTTNNGSFVQIPIWWTALSVALGLDVRGDIIKGVPCVKRFHQLFCPTAGNSYPIDKIERFIDDNKALMRRMYGDFEMNLDTGGPRQQTKKRRRRYTDEPDISLPPGVYPSIIPDDDDAVEAGDTYFGKLRNKRQTNQNRNQSQNRGGTNFNRNSGPQTPGPGANAGSSTGRLDACESKVEIVTPYWASNSAGKIRAIVNTQHFEQAIHQEICSKSQTSRCENDCGCEQKYKWHRLLAYDPDNDCKGIFMDWFLFPSCCVCRCNP